MLKVNFFGKFVSHNNNRSTFTIYDKSFEETIEEIKVSGSRGL